MAPQDPGVTGPGEPPDEILAGELVLGVLAPLDRAAALRRIEREPGFARQVAAWEAHFAPWLASLPMAEVPEHVWLRVRSQLGWKPATPAPAGLWSNAAFWRVTTALALAAGVAAVYLGRVGLAPAPMPPPVVQAPPPAGPATPSESAARAVTVLARDDGATAWLATVAADRDAVLMVPVPAAADPAGRVGELWIIPPGGAPLSLGFVSSEKAHTIAIPGALRDAFGTGATLAVSLESEAGMPHAAPTGPIVAKGTLAAI